MREARSSAPGLYLHIPFCSTICPYCDFSVMHVASPARQRFASRLAEEVSLAERVVAEQGGKPVELVAHGHGGAQQNEYDHQQGHGFVHRLEQPVQGQNHEDIDYLGH